LLDFIFVKGGKVVSADLCGSECRDSSVLSDHVPIWAEVEFEESNLASLGGGIDVSEDYRLQIEYAQDYSPIWTDAGSGADDDVSIWRPNGRKDFYRLGDYAVGSHRKPGKPATVVAYDDGSGALAKPAGYSRVWRDKGSGADKDVSLWKPIAPAGYQCLGLLATNGAKPATNDMRCVWRAFLTQGGNSKVWDDDGSGADADVGIYQAYAFRTTDSVSPGTFNATNSHSNAGDFKSYQTLNLDKVEFLSFKRTENAAISGHNVELLSNVDPADCAVACLDDSRKNWCVSFDYHKEKRACDLSDKRESEVGLKKNYSGNPFDHYSL